jgi:mono/diheme cytochrome c family protein
MLKVLAMYTVGAALLIGRCAGKTVWDGVYTAAQAEQGKVEYTDHCSGCHKDDLSGYDGVLKGEGFMQHWREDTLDNFFSVMKTTMPRGAPSSLSTVVYVDIASYILQANNFPAGRQELNVDAMRTIHVEGKSGPEEVPAGALVDVVGCLQQASGNDWILTDATDAVRTRNPNDSTDEELKRWEAKPLGKHKFGLMDAAAYHPDSRKGYKVEVKGFLIKNSEDERINVTALQTTATKCAR